MKSDFETRSGNTRMDCYLIRYGLSASSSFMRFFEFYMDGITFKRSAVEIGYRSARLVAFHFNESKTFAVT